MLNELQRSHARKISIIEGCFSTVWSSFTGGNYLTGFFIWLGTSPFLMSVYGALGPLANVIQPVFLTLLSHRIKSKKKLVVIAVALFKPLYFVLVLTALINNGLKIWMALIILFFFQVASSVAGPVWRSWMVDIVDQQNYGRYFGFRNLITQIVATVSILLAGYLLDILGKGFQAFLFVFITGSIFGLIDVIAFTHQDEEKSVKTRITDYHLFLELLKTPTDYRNFLILISIWTFSMNIFGPYATVMMINKFRYNYATLGLLSITSLLSSAAFQPIFGRLGDRHGNLKILRFTLLIQTMLNIGWILAIPTMYYMIPFQLVLGIIGTAGTGLLSSNFLMESAPTFGKTESFALYASFTSLAAFGGNIFSGILFLAFSGIHFKFLIWDFDTYRFVFMVSVIMSTFAMYRFLKFSRR